MAATLTAAPQQWKDSKAIEHIANVQKKLGKLSDLYVVAAGVPADRVDWLEKKLSLIKLKNLTHKYKFKVIASQQHGYFAMVIVAVEDPRNPLFYETMALGFCWVDQQWRAAPLPGLFALTGVGRYQKVAEKNRKMLERWAQTESKRLQRVGERAMLAALDKKFAEYKKPGMPLCDGTKNQAVEYFMRLSQQKDAIGLMACVLDDRSAVAAGVLSKKSVWSQILQRNFTYSVLPDVGIDGVVSVGVYFPESSPSLGILEFGLTRHEGCWTITIPESLKQNSDGDFPRNISQYSHLDRLNRKRIGDIKSLIINSLRNYPVRSSAAFQDKILAVTTELDFHRFIQLIDWKVSFLGGGLELSSGEVDQRFASAIALWQKLSTNKTSVREFLYKDNGKKYLLCNLVSYSVSAPLVLSSQPLLIVNNENSW
ncbi:hypothetical protein, partial [Rubritalea sp.]|uniref:hypothetical protein n=1 Tax=Rubritalea sp. TaxID=2109375 RepID=UPI003242DE22